MNSGMEAGRHRSATPIQTEEDPNISLADPAIRTERRRYLYAAQVPSLNARPPTFVYGDEEPISLEDVPVLTSTLEHTIIAPPEVMRRIEETKRERLAAEAEEAATGIKRPQEQGIWFSDETFVIGDPCPELLHYVEPYANGTKLEADGGGHRSPTPIQTEEDPIISLADPAIRTERRRYLYAAQVPSLNARPPTFVYGNEEPISLENVPVLTSTLEHTIIAPPEVMRRIEETKRERLAAEAEEAATGIKRPQEQGIWFSDETFVIGDPCPELLHYVEPYANGTKLEADGGGPVLKRHREDPNSAAADSSESGSKNN